MKQLLLVLVLAGCRNDAITYAKMLDPEATCSADCTYGGCTGVNTAYCSIRGTQWYCVAGKGPHRPVCFELVHKNYKIGPVEVSP